MNPIFIVCLLIYSVVLSITSHAQTVYVWEDEHGIVHFSDFAQSPHAQLITLSVDDHPAPEPQFSEAIPVDETLPNKASQPSSSQLPALGLQIISPLDQQTIRDNQGRIKVVVELSRPLTTDQHLQLMLNNQVYGAPNTQNYWELKNIDRGEHRLMIQAIENGKVIASTVPVTVYLHQARRH
ncbi:DUF4124 domain-containing protein [Vibrio metschnikovii]|uniref:DUF4124 domain-containing protein n=1 Tax=Vibrio injensis TaxID=1307414 RepID=UPI00093435B9|nr:DUF4124 domain-containing protein [Vibrio injensis]EKO3648183.1 DUF4124 domain-containing protein [Vibrio metschnikovii]EKO3714013.1 DUF4124 domain-containing protein [Vibrio metschnikovii]EKO3873160.1 DUF4124 domain-containing protein [Vibrio metschnikovii]EKO3897761.1 DUF4124 domain-containing protein [Vibrio metschnikovii]